MIRGHGWIRGWAQYWWAELKDFWRDYNNGYWT
jgi:hypothetical protein